MIYNLPVYMFVASYLDSYLDSNIYYYKLNFINTVYQ